MIPANVFKELKHLIVLKYFQRYWYYALTPYKSIEIISDWYTQLPTVIKATPVGKSSSIYDLHFLTDIIFSSNGRLKFNKHVDNVKGGAYNR